MLPILFTLTIPVGLGIPALIVASLLSGLWQYRTARLAGDGQKAAWKACATWTVGTAVVLYGAVKVLGGQNILHLDRPLAIPVHTYGILVASGFLVAMQLAARAAEQAGLSREKVLDLSFGILVAAMVGSRVLFIIVNWDEYKNDLPGIFQFWKGGLVFYGGFIGAVLFSIWYMRRHKMAFFSYADAMATPTRWPRPSPSGRRWAGSAASPPAAAGAGPATRTLRSRRAFRPSRSPTRARRRRG
jgi:phosphatidylglycerol:prolipoprotein diacylglycerol transferase